MATEWIAVGPCEGWREIDLHELGRAACAALNPPTGTSPKEDHKSLRLLYRRHSDLYCEAAIEVLRAAGLLVERR